jgi:Na+/melibiose symporter-like transporter
MFLFLSFFSFCVYGSNSEFPSAAYRADSSVVVVNSQTTILGCYVIIGIIVITLFLLLLRKTKKDSVIEKKQDKKDPKERARELVKEVFPNDHFNITSIQPGIMYGRDGLRVFGHLIKICFSQQEREHYAWIGPYDEFLLFKGE